MRKGPDDDGNRTQGHHHLSGRRAAGAVLRRLRILPDAHQGAARGEPRLVAADIRRSGQRQAGAVRAELRHKECAPQYLIDSCVGNDKPRPARPMWNMMNSDRFEQGLAAAGLTVNDIDYVMCTHLHVDHVGWNTRLENGRWVPTFPKAKYLMADRELAFWTQKEQDDPSGVPWITDSVLPIVAAKRAQIVKSDFAFNESIQFIPTPGHTIDHYSVLVGRAGQDALITGDMIHSPIQGKYPELGMRADYDSRAAGQTRRKVFDRFCEEATLMCVTNFPSPSTGRVRRWGDGYKFVA